MTTQTAPGSTHRKPLGERRFEWGHDGMRESDDGNYVLATDLRLAAPALLTALKRLLREADDDGITQDGVDEAFAAIAAATGEQKWRGSNDTR